MQALSQLSYGPTKLVSRAFYRPFSDRASVATGSGTGNVSGDRDRWQQTPVTDALFGMFL